MTHHSLTPPRWPHAALRAALPRDAVGDAILGDLHEEFVHDAARLGVAGARTLYWQRAAGVAARAALDELRLRSWARAVPAPAPAPAATPAATPAAGGRAAARLRMGADLGVGALAFAVLGVGIVVNTMLFATTRGAARHALPPAVGVGATALAVACAGIAAVVLCAGPRWLRRRLQRQARARA